ncbi:hypothetical protein PAMP_007833 [Pampus punctatissimus]
MAYINIMTLLNAFNLAEGTVTESNYDEILQNFNSTASGSEVLQGLSLNTCNLRTFLSDANFPVLDTLPYPNWVYIIIFLLAGLPCLFIPGFALYKLLQKMLLQKKTSINMNSTMCLPKSCMTHP